MSGARAPLSRGHRPQPRAPAEPAEHYGSGVLRGFFFTLSHVCWLRVFPNRLAL